MKDNKPSCPYRSSGLCYHPHGCIYIPHLNCMTLIEYRDILKSYRKKGKKKHERQRVKNRYHSKHGLE